MPERPATNRSPAAVAPPVTRNDEKPTAPVFDMLADDGATCVDGVCALPEPEPRHQH